jgi:outer membrane protein assembly factor BamB
LPQLPKPGITAGSQIKTLSIINSSNVANLRERTKVQLCDITKTSFQVPWPAITAAGDIVLIVSNETDRDYGSRTNQLRAYRTADGTLSWTVKEQYPPSDHAAHSFGAQVVADTLTLMPVDGSKLRAYDTLTGTLRWTTSPGKIGDMFVIPPNVYYNTVEGLTSYLNAMDPRNGNLLWKATYPVRGPGPPVMFADGSIVNSSDDGLRAYGPQLSSTRWTVNPVPLLLHLAPAVMGGTVYHSSTNSLYAFGLAAAVSELCCSE